MDKDGKLAFFSGVAKLFSKFLSVHIREFIFYI